MEKYIRSVKPLVSEDEFETTKALVEAFAQPGGQAEKLQQILLERAKTKENWMSEWWVDTAYFQFRSPVVVWSSPGLVFPLQDFQTEAEQLQYAAKLIAGAVDYKNLIDKDAMPLEMMGKVPLDMSQYLKIFATCRIPGLTKDSVRSCMTEPDPPKHILVMRNNHFFSLDVYDGFGKALSVKQLISQLENIVARSTRPTLPVGILTSQHRNVWGKAYKALARVSPSNAAFLERIQRSLFSVCLDTVLPPSSGEPMTDAALMCVHGGGSEVNSGNRFFDKTIQFVIGRSGHVGLTYEHSPAEGPPIANLMDHVVDFMEKGCQVRGQLPPSSLPRPARMEMGVTPSLEAEVERAAKVLDNMVDDLEMSCFNFEGFGKKFIKSQKISPDSFIQMAIQLAFYRIHGEPGAHYESGSVRQFLHGRTECIRSCSLESVGFCVAMLDADVSEEKRRSAMMEAIQGHKEYVMQAVAGKGVDRHLLGLKLAAIEAGMDVPDLFMDVSYMRSSHMRLSTSQVPARCAAFMCYGPLTPDGYGCCYNPRADSIVFGTSALNSSPVTHSSIFKAALQQSLLDMKRVLEATSTNSRRDG